MASVALRKDEAVVLESKKITPPWLNALGAETRQEA
jgi:hypothetical protein